jgi:hypothetical protein
LRFVSVPGVFISQGAWGHYLPLILVGMGKLVVGGMCVCNTVVIVPIEALKSQNALFHGASTGAKSVLTRRVISLSYRNQTADSESYGENLGHIRLSVEM